MAAAQERGRRMGWPRWPLWEGLMMASGAVREQIAPLLGVPTNLPAAPGTCPDVLALFSSHLEGQVSAEVCAEMERHIEACPRCKGMCDSLKRTLSLCRTAAPTAPVPAAVQASLKIALKSLLAGGA